MKDRECWMKSSLACVRVLLACTVCATVVAALIPSSGEQVFNDKLAHGAAFFVIVILGAFAFPGANLLAIAAGAAVLGGGIELLQDLITSTRHGDLVDFVADLAGIGLGLVLPSMLRLRERFLP